MARPRIGGRSTRRATSIWCGSSLIVFASSVISRSKPGTSAMRSASRRSSNQPRVDGSPAVATVKASSASSSTDQGSMAMEGAVTVR
jgi:hypothetical protein